MTNGAWLSKMLRNLRKPSGIRSAAVPKTVHATLRPYQKDGYTWLNYMQKLGFGACLADDMGLGKRFRFCAIWKNEKIRQRRKNASGRSGIPDWKLAEGGSKVCPGYDASGYSRKDICAACTGI